MQQALKDQLETIYQGMKESPNDFYTRIRYQIHLAGYADALRDQVAENIFMKGVHKQIALAIRTTPTVLDLTQKIAYAQRIWTTNNPNQYSFEQVTRLERMKDY